MRRVIEAFTALLAWPARRWATAVGAGVAFALVIAIPTALIKNPIFGRQIPPTWWSWPSLIVSSVLGGLLVATYVRDPAVDPPSQVAGDSVAAEGEYDDDEDRVNRRRGTIGGLLTFFAVGCPVCNKLVLIALGSAGAITWFEPIQPVLQAVAVALLGWALFARLEGERFCPVTPAAEPVGTRSGDDLS